MIESEGVTHSSEPLHSQVLIIDEISDPNEVRAVKSIAQRGVAMVATAHGVDLGSLLKNPDLNPLLGGLEKVTLGDQAAKCAPLCRAVIQRTESCGH